MATARKRKAGKKASPKKQATRKTGRQSTAQRAAKAREKAEAAASKVSTPKPATKRMSAAQQSVRDSLMLTRKLQGFSFTEIAAEFGVTKRTVELSIRHKREASEMLLDKDVVEIVEGMIEELQAAAVDFEKIALAAMQEQVLTAAIGAKKGAIDARHELRELLQSVGALPHDLGTVHHIVDIRAVVVQINENVEKFVAVVEEVDLPKEARGKVLSAAKHVSGTLDQIAEAPHAVGASNGGGSDEG